MPTTTYTPIATVTLASSTASVLFSSLPNIYRDIIIVINGAANQVGSPSLQFNSDAGSNYVNLRMFDNGSSGLSQAFTAGYASIGIMGTSPTMSVAQVMDYTSTAVHKNVIARGGVVGNTTRTEFVRWANTAAVTSITVLFDGAATYNTGTTISLFGVIV